MDRMVESKQDGVFEQSRKGHLMTVGFLTALKQNFDPETAFGVAVDGFSSYMTNYYKLVLGKTEKGSQRRFDTFRKHYENYAKKSDYIRIVESTPRILKVRFDRCPFAEVLKKYKLVEFTYAACLADATFTKELLPCVSFHREHVIAKGDTFCDHTWIYKHPKKLSKR